MSFARFGSSANAVAGAIAYGISCVTQGVWRPTAIGILPAFLIFSLAARNSGYVVGGLPTPASLKTCLL
jgi:hypothetical protein